MTQIVALLLVTEPLCGFFCVHSFLIHGQRAAVHGSLLLALRWVLAQSLWGSDLSAGRNGRRGSHLAWQVHLSWGGQGRRSSWKQPTGSNLAVVWMSSAGLLLSLVGLVASAISLSEYQEYCCSFAGWCQTRCDPVHCSTPVFPVFR